MSRKTRTRARMSTLAGLVMLASTACQIPVGNIGGFINCTLYIGEPAQGLLAIDVVPGTIGVGCSLGL